MSEIEQPALGGMELLNQQVNQAFEQDETPPEEAAPEGNGEAAPEEAPTDPIEQTLAATIKQAINNAGDVAEAEPEPQEQAQEKPQEPQKKQSRASQRIQDLISREKEAKRENAELRNRLDSLEKQLESAAPEEGQPDDQQAAELTQAAQPAEGELEDQLSPEIEEVCRAGMQHYFNKMAPDGRERFKNWDEVVNDKTMSASLAPDTFIALTDRDSGIDNRLEVLYHICNNSDVARNIGGMTGANRIIALRDLDTKFSRQKSRAAPSVPDTAPHNASGPSIVSTTSDTFSHDSLKESTMKQLEELQ